MPRELSEATKEKLKNANHSHFQYWPASGELPAHEFTKQTEKAINEIGNIGYVSFELADEALEWAKKAYEEAMALAQEALNAANNAQVDATNALNQIIDLNLRIDGIDNSITNIDNNIVRLDSRIDYVDEIAVEANNRSKENKQAISTIQADITNIQTELTTTTITANLAHSMAQINAGIIDILDSYVLKTDPIDLNKQYDLARFYIENLSSTHLPIQEKGLLDVDVVDPVSDDSNIHIVRQQYLGLETYTLYFRSGIATYHESTDTTTVVWKDWEKHISYTELKKDFVRFFHNSSTGLRDVDLSAEGDIVLGNGRKIFSKDSSDQEHNLLKISGYTKAEFGDKTLQININTLDRPIVNLPAAQEQVAYLRDLEEGLELKVDKVAGKQLSTEDFTTSEKEKLAGLESSHFKGEFSSYEALVDAHPTAKPGDYARVDGGEDESVAAYIWDSSDQKWVMQLGESTAETPVTVKEKYESNPDTNAFTDSNKNKLAEIEAGAQVNKIESIKVNNFELAISDKEVAIFIPASFSELNDDIGIAKRAELDEKAPIYSPEFLGIPKVPVATEDEQAVNLGQMRSEIQEAFEDVIIPTVPVASVNGKTGQVTITATDVGAALVNHNHPIAQITGLFSGNELVFPDGSRLGILS